MLFREELWSSAFSICYDGEVRSGDVFAVAAHCFTHQIVSVYRIPDILPETKTQLWLSKLYSTCTVIFEDMTLFVIFNGFIIFICPHKANDLSDLVTQGLYQNTLAAYLWPLQYLLMEVFVIFILQLWLQKNL